MSKKERARRQEARERGELKKQLLTYSIAAGAALIGGSAVEAAVIYSGPQNLMANVNGETLQIDINDDGINEVGLNVASSAWATAGSTSSHTTSSSTTSSVWDSYGWSRAVKAIPAAPSHPPGGTHMALIPRNANGFGVNYAKGATIGVGSWDGAQRFLALSRTQSGLPSTYGPFLGTDSYLGVKFLQAGFWYTGWVGLEVPADASYARVTGWAYESAGGAIIAGAGEPDPVPEPTGLALLATGAAGLMVFRKKRTE